MSRNTHSPPPQKKNLTLYRKVLTAKRFWPVQFHGHTVQFKLIVLFGKLHAYHTTKLYNDLSLPTLPNCNDLALRKKLEITLMHYEFPTL